MSSSSSFYLHVRPLTDQLEDALARASALYELALERRDPLTSEEKSRAQAASYDLVQVTRKLALTAEWLKREAGKL